MGKSRVISIRIDEKKIEMLENAGVNIVAEIKKLIEQLAWKVTTKERIKQLMNVISQVPPERDGYSVREVRSDRESR